MESGMTQLSTGGMSSSSIQIVTKYVLISLLIVASQQISPKPRRSPLETGFVSFSDPSSFPGKHIIPIIIHKKEMEHPIKVIKTPHVQHEWVPGHVHHHSFIPGHHVIIPSAVVVSRSVEAVVVHPVRKVNLYDDDIRNPIGGFGVGIGFGGPGAGHGFQITF